MAVIPAKIPPQTLFPVRHRRVLFVGNPNTGKTTLFNRLTGLRAKTSNYPGTTVELRKARLSSGTDTMEIVDLPGLYSLEGTNPDERVAAEYLKNACADPENPPLVVLVADATHLERCLSLFLPLREKTCELLIALNMSDLARRSGLAIDIAHLTLESGAPVVPVSARTGEGLDRLREQIWQRRDPDCPRHRVGPAAASTACGACHTCPYAARYDWAEKVCSRACRRETRRVSHNQTEPLDRWATHPVYGLILFGLVMGTLFQAIFWLAAIPMTWIDDTFTALGSLLGELLPDGLLQSFLVDGVVAGVGGTLIFLPQICILFFLISLLEGTGYLARATFVVDRWMSKAGLPGKAFVPMLSAHACAIPAILGARTIENPRDRLVTILVLPLLSCAARIPVYVMVTAMLFPSRPALAAAVFTAAYFLGLLAAFTVAFVFQHTLFKGKTEPLLLELPSYKYPSLQTAFLAMFDRGYVFLRKAGTLILVISIVLWALARFPALDESSLSPQLQQEWIALQASGADTDTLDNFHAQAQLKQSAIGRIGQSVQPVFAPLGFDWQITVGVLSSFAAREVVASTLSILYGMGDSGADHPESIAERLRESVPAAAGLSLLVFFILAMQCLPTQIVTRRETGSWKWPFFQLAYMSALAYGAAFLTYQTALWLI